MKNNWPDNLTIQQYLQGRLDKEQMHELEKRALDDPFLADALEGFAQTSAADHGLSILQRQLHERIAHQHENKKVFDLTWQRLSIAAAAAVMFITAGVLFWMNSQVPDDPMAVNQKRVEVSVTPVDSMEKDGALLSHSDKIPAPKEPAAKPSVNTGKSAARVTVKSKVQDAVEKGESLNAALITREANTISAYKQAKVVAENVKGFQLGDSSSLTLSEVVVNGFNADSGQQAKRAKAVQAYKTYADENIFRASPAGGWEAYRKYLRESTARAAVALNQKGKVAVGFKVDQAGTLYDLKVLQGLSATADSAALHIIRSGPGWKAAADGKIVDLKIDLDF